MEKSILSLLVRSPCARHRKSMKTNVMSGCLRTYSRTTASCSPSGSGSSDWHHRYESVQISET